jgi:hypothetical protein
MFGLAVGMATPLAYSQAVADPAPNVELAVTYTAERASSAPGSSFWLQGGSVKLGAELYHGLGIAFNVTGTYTKSIPGSSTGLGLLTTTIGPRYTHALARQSSGLRGKTSVFAEGLIGEAHAFKGLFPAPGGTLDSSWSFASQLGGGVDVGVSRHLAVRMAEASWVRMQLPNALGNVQNDLRLGAGLVYRFNGR